MAELLDVIELTIDVPDRGLRAGTQGTIVHCHTDGAFEVEFANEDGETTELLVLPPDQFIVVWRASTKEWVPAAERVASLVSKLPEDSIMEVLKFARYQSVRRQGEISTAAGRSGV